MKKIRRGMFETNSSMTHAICIVTEDDFKKFQDGEKIYDRDTDELVDIEGGIDDEEEYRFWDYENYGGEYCEITIRNFTSPSGDKMVAMCYYGQE